MRNLCRAAVLGLGAMATLAQTSPEPVQDTCSVPLLRAPMSRNTLDDMVIRPPAGRFTMRYVKAPAPPCDERPPAKPGKVRPLKILPVSK